MGNQNSFDISGQNSFDISDENIKKFENTYGPYITKPLNFEKSRYRSWWKGFDIFGICWVTYLSNRFDGLIVDIHLTWIREKPESFFSFLFVNGKSEFIKRSFNDLLFQKTIEKYDEIDPNKNKEWISLGVNLNFENEGHANVLLLNRKTGIAEYFEPHGSKFSGFAIKTEITEDVTNYLEFWLEENWKDFKQLIPPSDLCYKNGIQGFLDTRHLKESISGDGNCYAFTLLFIHLRILFPNEPFKDILRLLENQKNKSSILSDFFTFLLC